MYVLSDTAFGVSIDRMAHSDKYSVEPHLVQKQLQKILAFEAFKKSKVLTRFLTFIVDETLAGRAYEFKEYTIGRKALNKPSDFNPQIDAAVRIHAGRLRRVLAEYYLKTGAKDPVYIEVPKGNYTPVFSHHQIEEQPAPAFIDDKNNNGNNYHKLFHRKVTVAVFPFQNRSQDNSKDFFVDGVGEQLCIDLAKFQQLSVISYNSTRKAAAENKNVGDLDKIYKIDYVLTGSVRLSDKDIQVNIQFLLAESSTLIWTHSYMLDHKEKNLYSLKDEMIEQIVNSIADVDGIISKNVSDPPLSDRKEIFGVNCMIFEYYHSLGKYDANSFSQACSVVERAMAVDPSNAMICAFRAELYLKNHIFQITPATDCLENAKIYVDKALDLDQKCQYAHKTWAWISLLTGKQIECVEAIETCLELNSKAMSIIGNIGFLLICLGKYSEGFQLLQKSKSLNSVLSWYGGLGFALYYFEKENYSEALNWIQRSNIPSFPLRSLLLLATKGKIKEMAIENTVAELGEDELRKLKQIGETNILREYIHDKVLLKKLKEGLEIKTTTKLKKINN